MIVQRTPSTICCNFTSRTHVLGRQSEQQSPALYMGCQEFYKSREEETCIVACRAVASSCCAALALATSAMRASRSTLAARLALLSCCSA